MEPHRPPSSPPRSGSSQAGRRPMMEGRSLVGQGTRGHSPPRASRGALFQSEGLSRGGPGGGQAGLGGEKGGGARFRPNQKGGGDQAGLLPPLEEKSGGGAASSGNKPISLEIPAELECCGQGGSCCWRWLGHVVLEEVAALKAELTQTDREYSEFKKTRSALEHDAEAFVLLKEEHAAMMEDYQRLRVAVPNLEAERDEQRQNLDRLGRYKDDLEREKGRLEHTTRNLMEKLDQSNELKVEAERESNRAREQETFLSEQLKTTESEKKELNVNITMLKSQLAALQKQIDDSSAKKKKGKGKKK